MILYNKFIINERYEIIMKTVGIIGAMPSELVDIREALPTEEIIKKAGYEFYISSCNNVKVVSVCCGVAKVNAAICTQVLIDSFAPAFIVNTGIAGGMDVKVKVCDVVIADCCEHHDVTTRFLENYPPYCSKFRTDEMLIKAFSQTCEKLNVPYHIGEIVSGEQFISDNAVKKTIVDAFSPLAVDMESAGIAHCCMRNEMPFATVRCISDNADDEGEMSFEEFEKIAAKRNADVVIETIKSL